LRPLNMMDVDEPGNSTQSAVMLPLSSQSESKEASGSTSQEPASYNIHLHLHTHVDSKIQTSQIQKLAFTPEQFFGIASNSSKESSIDHSVEIVEASRSSFEKLTTDDDIPALSFPFFNPAKLKSLDFRLSVPVDAPKECANLAASWEDSLSKQHQYVPVWKHQQHSRLARKAKLAFYHVGNCTELGEKKLMAAIKMGNKYKVSKLLNEGIKPNYGDIKKRTPLHFAVNQREHAIVHLLLSMGANPNATDVLKNTPLHLGVVSGDRHMVKLLIENGADIHQKDMNGRTPLSILKARVLMWRNEKNLSMSWIKEEFLAMVEILQQHAAKCLTATTPPMDDLCQRMAGVSTREQADIVADAIINEMLHLDIQSKSDGSHSIL